MSKKELITMKPDHKKIEVPLFIEPTNISSTELTQVLKTFGTHSVINEINWKAWPYAPETEFWIGRSLTHLYILYNVNENGVRATYINDNDPVYKNSCAEFFVQIPGNGNPYFNFEFNAIGTMLAGFHAEGSQGCYLGQSQTSRIMRVASLGSEPIEKSTPTHWEIIVGIPFEILGLDGLKLPTSLRCNFFKCGDETSTPHFVSWNPIEFHKPNFHLPEFFGEIYF